MTKFSAEQEEPLLGDLPVIDEQFVAHMPWYGVEDQRAIEQTHLAVAGLGGAGGYALEFLSRRGVSTVTLADLDISSVSNRNRQAGSNRHNVGREKIAIAADVVDGIHGERANIRRFSEGVTFGNIDSFLEDVDVVIDAVDIQVPAVAVALGRKAVERGIPMFVGIEVGDGCSVTCFRPDPHSYEETSDAYYGVLPGQDLEEVATSLMQQLVHLPEYAMPEMLEATISGAVATPAGPEGAGNLGATMAALVKRWIIEPDKQSFEYYFPKVLVNDPFETGVIIDNKQEHLAASLKMMGSRPMGSGKTAIKGRDYKSSHGN